MSNSSLIVYTQISPNRNSPRNQPISKITIHHMAGNMTLQSFGAMVAKTSRQMSANYAIDSQGNRGLYCPESDRSWCSSSPWNDHRAVTIEVANDGGAPDWHVSDAAIDSLIELCVDICKRNGMTKLEYTGDQTGSGVERLAAVQYTGNRLDIAFNALFVTQAVKAVGSEDVTLCFTAEMKPFVVKNPNDESIVELITPMRTR